MQNNENLIDDTNEETFQWEPLPEFYHEYMVDLYYWMDHPLTSVEAKPIN